VAGDVYLDGLTNVLAEPEFSGSEDARRALRLLEERSLLQDLLAHRAQQRQCGGGVQVLIGGEGTWDELRQTSVILTRYGTPGLATGTLGVLGPMRLPYGRTISTMRFLSSLLSDLVSETLIEEVILRPLMHLRAACKSFFARLFMEQKKKEIHPHRKMKSLKANMTLRRRMR
jgi:heat-inducible transcriptional repressor